ncbi:bilin-binding protein-like [Battus philenor]|uniref:bilin-binding protein-like n=1 Tax=Battus philenor TaxID=42288 RepID=UPI0035CFE6B6
MLLYLFVAVLAFAKAEVTYDGPCPDVPAMENFDLSAYQGTWYEIARYPNVDEEYTRGKCTRQQYRIDGNSNKGTLKNSHVIDGVRSSIRAEVSQPEPGKIMTTYSFGGVSRSNDMNVLTTDYNNYSITYKCKNLPDSNQHRVFAWIFSRNKSLDGPAKQSVEDFLKNSQAIDSNKLVDNDQSEEACSASVNRVITHFLKF